MTARWKPLLETFLRGCCRSFRPRRDPAVDLIPRQRINWTESLGRGSDRPIACRRHALAGITRIPLTNHTRQRMLTMGVMRPSSRRPKEPQQNKQSSHRPVISLSASALKQQRWSRPHLARPILQPIHHTSNIDESQFAIIADRLQIVSGSASAMSLCPICQMTELA
jgi:hypothetical protein